MKFCLFAALALLLTACDLRSEDRERYVGTNYTEPDAQVLSAYWVYKQVDPQTGDEVIIPILQGQSPVVGTQIGLCVNFRIRSGSDAKTLTYRILDDAGNVIVADQKYRFRRDREKGGRHRERQNELIHLWHPANGHRNLTVQIRFVNGFRDPNQANDTRQVLYTAVTLNQNPPMSAATFNRMITVMYCPECGATVTQARSPGAPPKCPHGCKINHSVPMSPEIARMRKQRANQGPIIENHLNILMRAIAKASEEGKDQIIIHLALNEHGTRTSLKRLDHNGEQALLNALRNQGWTVTHHDDPDHGSPVSTGDYYTVSGW